MDIVLVAANSKYIHTNPAVRSIKYYVEKQGFSAEIIELTGKEEIHRACGKILSAGAKIVAFSCYIWNIEYMLKLAQTVKKSEPEVNIIFGGPEAYCNGEKLIKENSFIDCIIYGEGEIATCEILRNGILEKIIQGEKMDLSQMGFIYSDKDLEDKSRIFYYESSRGCPFNCTYCLSCIDKGVRFKPVQMVKADLERFARAGVRLVKFIDRTFNADMKRAKEILEIIKNLEGETEFHIEVSPDNIDDEFVFMLGEIKKGRIRVEAGLQSINPETLTAVNRPCNLNRVSRNIKGIRRMGVTVHLDLIAGLPYEDIESFKKSFNFAFELGPDELQLGFLKVLPQTELCKNSAEYGMVYDEFPPYEIISNSFLSAEDITRLKNLEAALDIYHNSGILKYSERLILDKFSSPFEMYDKLGEYLSKNGYLDFPHQKAEYFEFLFDFAKDFDLGEEITKDYYVAVRGGKPCWVNGNITLEKRIITEILSEGAFENLPELTKVKATGRHKFAKFYFCKGKYYLVSLPDMAVEEITEIYERKQEEKT